MWQSSDTHKRISKLTAENHSLFQTLNISEFKKLSQRKRHYNAPPLRRHPGAVFLSLHAKTFQTWSTLNTVRTSPFPKQQEVTYLEDMRSEGLPQHVDARQVDEARLQQFGDGEQRRLLGRPTRKQSGAQQQQNPFHTTKHSEYSPCWQMPVPWLQKKACTVRQ